MKKSKTRLKKRSHPVLNKSELVLSIRLLSATLKNGHELLSGINYLKDTMSDPLSSEFKLITQQHLLGVDSVDLWVDFANRNKIPAIHQLVQVLLMGMHFGAPVSHLLDQLAQDILENKVSLKKDQKLSILFSKTHDPSQDRAVGHVPAPESYRLSFDEDFLQSHDSIHFLKESLLVGKNVLIVCNDFNIRKMLTNHFRDFQSLDLEKEHIAQVLLGLSENPLEKGQLLFINGTNVRSGLQRAKALLAFQERSSNTTSLKLLLDLFHLIPHQISFTTNKVNQSWMSEFSELRTVSEEGSFFIEPIFETIVTGLNIKRQNLGHFRATGYIPSALSDIEMGGGEVSRSIFIR